MTPNAPNVGPLMAVGKSKQIPMTRPGPSGPTPRLDSEGDIEDPSSQDLAGIPFDLARSDYALSIVELHDAPIGMRELPCRTRFRSHRRSGIGEGRWLRSSGPWAARSTKAPAC